MKRLGVSQVTAIVIALLMFSTLSLGQGTRGTITGTVNDATGAVVPGAEITILEKATGVETKSVTSGAGVYRAPYLPPGIYKVCTAAECPTEHLD
jgi:hypothetical protein